MSIIEAIDKASQKLDKTDLSGVIKLSKQIVDQSKIVNDLTDALKSESKKLNKLRYEDLPELMNELDIISQEIEVDGKVFKIAKAEKFFASIREENVHTGSFKALVKDEIQKGANVPLEELGVNRVVEATIKEVVK